jgi:predicted RNA-binding protein YlxR (DUF448 family)
MGEPCREAQALLLRFGKGGEKEGKHLEKRGCFLTIPRKCGIMKKQRPRFGKEIRRCELTDL